MHSLRDLYQNERVFKRIFIASLASGCLFTFAAIGSQLQ